ncbi:MAG TPA: tail fiber protein [Stellaceae bacterium]|jgi:microcystin-dependent protein|nr:tail fiber protein [Stellaceae bacterium]
MEPFLGQISIFGCNFAPVGWSFCQGQTLSIAQSTALFSLLGTTFGGNGVNTFMLPDLRSRAPVGSGQGPGLSSYVIGESGGVETVPIDSASYPAHSHGLFAAASTAAGNLPAGLIEAEGQTGGRGGAIDLALYSASGTATTLAAASLTAAPGGGAPHNNVEPYLALNFCIALQGIFPSRS